MDRLEDRAHATDPQRTGDAVLTLEQGPGREDGGDDQLAGAGAEALGAAVLLPAVLTHALVALSAGSTHRPDSTKVRAGFNKMVLAQVSRYGSGQ